MQESLSLILYYQHITVDLFLWPERKPNEIVLQSSTKENMIFQNIMRMHIVFFSF